jgi:aspartyl-tRNA(Asn)/glutamyl-tRNA(Gln) amidotransferase subunit A
MSHLKTALKLLSNQAKYSHLNAFTSLANGETILDAATLADSIPAARNEAPLSGNLIAIKDNICTKDSRTTAASETLMTFTSPYDATVVQKLRDAGAVIAGKTNMDEFGMGSHNTNSVFGPASLSRFGRENLSAGGSSGGSALAVASAQCWAWV